MHYLYHSIAVISLAAHIHQAYGAPVGPVNVIAEAVERAISPITPQFTPHRIPGLPGFDPTVVARPRTHFPDEAELAPKRIKVERQEPVPPQADDSNARLMLLADAAIADDRARRASPQRDLSNEVASDTESSTSGPIQRQNLVTNPVAPDLFVSAPPHLPAPPAVQRPVPVANPPSANPIFNPNVQPLVWYKIKLVSGHSNQPVNPPFVPLPPTRALLRMKNQYASLKALLPQHEGKQYSVIWKDLGIEWEMAQSLGGMSKILSPEALARLQSGQLSDEALSAIKTSAHADFENVVRAKYGDAAVQSLGDAIQRRALIAKLQQAYLSSLGGTHRRSEHLFRNRIRALELIAARVDKVYRRRVFEDIPADIMRAIEYELISSVDLDFYKKLARLKLDLLTEEDRLGLNGLAAQKRVTSK